MTGRTRRDVLAGLATAALAGGAGCTLPWDDGPADTDRETQFSPSEYREILSASAPDAQRPVPLQPEPDVIDAGLQRCSELIDTVPTSISAEEVPNGVVRDEIESLREDAVRSREAVTTAHPRFRALLSLPDARASALNAAAAFEAVQADLAESLESTRRDVRETVGSRLAQVEYTGDDRGRTLLLAYRIEQALLTARNRTNRGFDTFDPGVLDVGEVAADVEYGAATIDSVDALADRHAATVESPTAYASTVAATIDSTRRAVGRADLPDPDTTPEELVERELTRDDLRQVLQLALRGVHRWEETISTELTAGRLASGLSTAFGLERDSRALEAVVDRVADDDIPELTSAAPITREREAAIDAAQSVSIDRTSPSLAGDVVARTLRRFAWTDDELERYVERERSADLTREYASYVYLRAQLDALPAAIDAVHERLDAWANASWG